MSILFDILLEADIPADMKFYDGVRDSYKDEVYGTLLAYKPGLDWDNPQPGYVYGKIDWSKYDGVTKIDWIRVADKFKRKGVGTAMVKELERLHDRVEWSLTTPEGEALRKSIYGI